MKEPVTQSAEVIPEKDVKSVSPEREFFAGVNSGAVEVPGVTIHMQGTPEKSEDSTFKSLGIFTLASGFLLAALALGFQAGTYYLEREVKQSVETEVSEKLEAQKRRIDELEKELGKLQLQQSMNP